MSAATASPGDSLVRPALPVPASDHRRRVVRLLLLRTLVVTAILGISLWLEANAELRTRSAVWLQSTIIAATYVSSIVFGVQLRRGLEPQKVAVPMLANDLVLTSALVYVTGGALSPFSFLYSLTIVTAGALAFRRGAIVVSACALGALIGVSLLAWVRAFDVPMPVNVIPWGQSRLDFARTLGVQIGLTAGVGALAYIFGDQLQRGAETLATTRRAAAGLLSLHQDIVRSLSSGLITITGDGEVLTANEAAAEILGVEQGDLIGRPIERVLPRLGAGLDATGGPRRADLVVAARGKELVIGATVSPLRDEHDEVIGRIVNFQDLTELKRLEQHARRAERLATVGQLAAGIAHEIRNPLAAISGSIELLSQSPQAPASDDDKTLMNIVHREVQRLNVLIGDLLDYTNQRPKQPVDFDLAVLVDEVVQVAKSDRAFTAVELASEIERPVMVHADPAKLRQVVWNLLRNAADAAGAGGKHVRVTVAGAAGKDATRISVEDDGPGIPPDVLARIFDPFFTTKPKGTGLGLATSHAVVAEHGGRIDVETELGKGTKMVVSLPRPG